MTRTERLVLTIAVLASFVAFLDGTVVNVALPAIMEELGGGIATQQWVVDAYLITLGSLILLAGSLSDVLGRVLILRIGLVGFGAASLFCALAPTAELLIVSRGLQGIAGALLVPSSLALILSAFRGAEQSKAIGQWTAWTSGAFLAGPLLGGLFVDYLSWRWVFAINVLPIAVTLWLLVILKQRDERSHLLLHGLQPDQAIELCLYFRERSRRGGPAAEEIADQVFHTVRSRHLDLLGQVTERLAKVAERIAFGSHTVSPGRLGGRECEIRDGSVLVGVIRGEHASGRALLTQRTAGGAECESPRSRCRDPYAVWSTSFSF